MINIVKERKQKLKLIRSSIEFNMMKYRILATSLDIIILFTILAVIIIPFGSYIMNIKGFLSNELYDFHIYFFVYHISFVLYGGIFESSKYKGTIGQILFNVKILDKNSKKLSFAKACFRNFVKFYAYPLLLICFLFYLLINQMIIPLFDKVSGVKIMLRNERDEEMF